MCAKCGIFDFWPQMGCFYPSGSAGKDGAFTSVCQTVEFMLVDGKQWCQKRNCPVSSYAIGIIHPSTHTSIHPPIHPSLYCFLFRRPHGPEDTRPEPARPQARRPSGGWVGERVEQAWLHLRWNSWIEVTMFRASTTQTCPILTMEVLHPLNPPSPRQMGTAGHPTCCFLSSPL